MNRTAVLRLAWKEYRAVRGFWLAMIGLVAALQWIDVALTGAPSSISMFFGLALAAPAAFALGCCGAAFAVEKEEGTFDFLHAAPVTARELVVSKLGVSVSATAAMFVVLWLLALVATGGVLPKTAQLHGLLGVWPLAAVEAIAWGTLFSLLSARPLLAVCLGFAAASTVTHLLAWSSVPPPFHAFETAPYLAAIPRRVIVTLLVLAVDIYLGLRWLDSDENATRAENKRLEMARRLRTAGGATDGDAALADRLRVRADRGTVLGRLLWQHWRQSAWMMATMAILYCLLEGGLFASLGGPAHVIFSMLCVPPALMGALVFRADQERSRFRFFVEHNVPPRYVWISRQVPWIALLILLTPVACLAALGANNLVQLYELFFQGIGVLEQRWIGYFGQPITQIGSVTAPLTLGLTLVAVSYAAGQWVSMMVRSGIMAGFLGIVLAELLGGWTVLMDAFDLSFLWSVLPIVVVLLWATWRRAPDWISENTSWQARRGSAATVLVPAVMLVGLVPTVRVLSIMPVDPGIDVDRYLANSVTPDALATGELYRQANATYESPTPARGEEVPIHQGGGRYTTVASRRRSIEKPLTEYDERVLAENAQSLSQVLEAAARPHCTFDDPRRVTDPIRLRRGLNLVDLVIASGRQLEAEGKLDEAADRYFVAIRVAADLDRYIEFLPTDWRPMNRFEALRRAFAEFGFWAAQKGQTRERIEGAIERLQALDSDILGIHDFFTWQYVVADRYVFGDATAWPAMFLDWFNWPPSPSVVWPTVAPWESYRGKRRLNEISADAMEHMAIVKNMIRENLGASSGMPVLPEWSRNGYVDPYDSYYYRRDGNPWRGWIDSLTPNLAGPLESIWIEAERFATFETQRRATIVVMALEAYRLDHHDLPLALEELVTDGYLERLPLDPYSGDEFRYFPLGLPEPRPWEPYLFAPLRWQIDQLPRDTACVWSTGPHVEAVPWGTQRRGQVLDDKVERVPIKSSDTVAYRLRKVSLYDFDYLSDAEALGRGLLFHVPTELGE